MHIYCLEDFKVEFEKLKSHKSYKSIEKEVVDYFFTKTKEELLSGTRLNGSSDSPYIKKRLGGSGGFRVYFLIVIKNDALYLMYVYPKTGSLGYDNMNDATKAYLYKKVLDCIEKQDFYECVLDSSGEQLLFGRPNGRI